MLDQRLNSLNKHEKASFITNRQAQAKADGYQDTLKRLVDKKDKEEQEKTERREKLLDVMRRKNIQLSSYHSKSQTSGSR